MIGYGNVLKRKKRSKDLLQSVGNEEKTIVELRLCLSTVYRRRTFERTLHIRQNASIAENRQTKALNTRTHTYTDTHKHKHKRIQAHTHTVTRLDIRIKLNKCLLQQEVNRRGRCLLEPEGSQSKRRNQLPLRLFCCLLYISSTDFQE